jgi:hypothetical protein
MQLKSCDAEDDDGEDGHERSLERLGARKTSGRASGCQSEPRCHEGRIVIEERRVAEDERALRTLR